MPKNTKKQKNAKTKGGPVVKRELTSKTEDQEYAFVIKILGNKRVMCDCLDGKQRLCIIRGNMRKGELSRVRLDDVVIISLREYQDDKADIVHRFTTDEVTVMRKRKILPPLIEKETDDVFEFIHSDEEKDELDISCI